MNILPKKRWHVRTRENINRVRRDEAKAAEAEREKEKRIELAEREARIDILRSKARSKLSDAQVEESAPVLEHVNLFQDLESGETTKNTNSEREAEKKKEQEEWEKKVGILTYLGGERVETSWWERAPEDRLKKETEDKGGGDSTSKDALDPLNQIRNYLGCSGIKRYLKNDEKPSKRRGRSSSSSSEPKKRKKKSKKSKKKSKKKSHKRKKRPSSSEDSSSSSDDPSEKDSSLAKKQMIEKLRLERLNREKKERIRENRVMIGQDPDPLPEPKPENKDTKRKYNSQFNPEVARQNKLNANTKYWLQ